MKKLFLLLTLVISCGNAVALAPPRDKEEAKKFEEMACNPCEQDDAHCNEQKAKLSKDSEYNLYVYSSVTEEQRMKKQYPLDDAVESFLKDPKRKINDKKTCKWYEGVEQ